MEHPTYFAIVFGATYTALYTRYSSQWQYLADLYNRIKAKEIDLAASEPMAPAAKEKLAQWKAAFISDALVMHLIHHESYETVALAWLSEPAVQTAYDDATGGNAEELKTMLQRSWSK